MFSCTVVVFIFFYINMVQVQLRTNLIYITCKNGGNIHLVRRVANDARIILYPDFNAIFWDFRQCSIWCQKE